MGEESLTGDHFLSVLDGVAKEADSVFYSHSCDIQMELMSKWKRVNGNVSQKYLFFQDITGIERNGKKIRYAGKRHGAQIGKNHAGFGLLVSRDTSLGSRNGGCREAIQDLRHPGP